jgi:hypothetical protein
MNISRVFHLLNIYYLYNEILTQKTAVKMIHADATAIVEQYMGTLTGWSVLFLFWFFFPISAGTVRLGCSTVTFGVYAVDLAACRSASFAVLVRSRRLLSLL